MKTNLKFVYAAALVLVLIIERRLDAVLKVQHE